jgi:hypothetical protein
VEASSPVDFEGDDCGRGREHEREDAEHEREGRAGERGAVEAAPEEYRSAAETGERDDDERKRFETGCCPTHARILPPAEAFVSHSCSRADAGSQS